MKWINSRRFILCLICLAIIAYVVIFSKEAMIIVVGHLTGVLMVFMGATTVEKATEKIGNYSQKKKSAQ